MIIAVLKDTTIIIHSGDVSVSTLSKEIVADGYDLSQVEILTQTQFDERKALEPTLIPQPSEIEKLRLEMARSNAEMFETMIMLIGGGA